MANKLDITAERVRSILSYDHLTGDFLWLPRGRGEFKSDRYYRAWNSRFLGKLAGCDTLGHYGRINVSGKVYFKHHLAWLHYYGELPSSELDHIDLDKSNNRIANLRLASHSENMRNSSLRSHNKLGVKGVCLDMGFYRAQLKVNGALVFNKRFRTLDEAKAAYEAAVDKYHGDFGRME